ncbi:sulfurtransferase complex subunit TusD [Buchnera aphidicola (Brachycaudus cardui)]|uniref:Sulfurtransferase TusD n=1 Tax=Buchnera aphidicola (Brachycaudus cardui) TaxID=557993 RepID=A0A4D6XV75_9GAMM|nr:sulfurtransferase complex subunit TusD [Buchnera aphidicola]QCI20653.1 sulfurtransferase complex subunit TusD [Buchnera aphidicola (Brachycaudus cardui)]
MNYTILVTGAAYGTQNASTAFLFCQALVQTKNILHSIFFYCDGVYNANSMTTPAIDEFNLIKAWQNLNKKYKVNLYVCNSAALRRGVIEDELIVNANIKKGNLDRFFQLSGLIELANSINICDRIIQF